MIADIATGHSAGADVLFLIAAIVFALAAVGAVATSPLTKWVGFLTNAGLVLVAVAWLIL